MRTPSAVVALSLLGLLAACSRSKPERDAVLGRDLDLALKEFEQPAPVASPLELAGEVKAEAKAPAKAGKAEPVHVRKKAPTRKPAPAPKREPAPHVAAAQPAPSAETAPAPVASAPEPAPSREPADAGPQDEPRDGHGPIVGRVPGPTDVGGRFPGMPGGINLPGIGGVIILRGGHSGIDPCDEHDRGRVGRGGFPGIPNGIAGGYPIGGNDMPRG